MSVATYAAGLLILSSAAAKTLGKSTKFNPLKNILDFDQPKRAGIKAYYINLAKSTDRAACISKQLDNQFIEHERFAAAEAPPCGDWDFKCFQEALLGPKHRDCFKSGADLIHMFEHGSKGKSQVAVAGAVLANWCSHKRLLNLLEKNTSQHYGMDQLMWSVGQKVGGALHIPMPSKPSLNLVQEKKASKKGAKAKSGDTINVKKVNGTAERVYIIMEDDAILKPNFGKTVEDFVRNYAGDWDMVQVDTFGNTRDDEKIGEFNGQTLWHPSAKGEYFGLHCILVKESAVGKLNTMMGLMPAVPVDWFPKLLKDVPGTLVLAWKPEIVINPEMKIFGVNTMEHMPRYCKDSILVSDISGDAATHA